MFTLNVAVVILNYNGVDFLKQFLPTVIKYSGNAQIIIADNNSSDESIEFLKQNFLEVQIVANDANYGYAKGYNEALKKVNADVFVLLNSDVEVTENWLAPIIQEFEADKLLGAAQPKLIDFKNRNEFEYAGASGGFIDNYGYPFCRGRLFNTLEKDIGQYNESREIFWATGACLFVRATRFWAIGGFDDNYFAHMEEIDLCWRLKNTGNKIKVIPQSVVYHIGGGTLNKLSRKKTFLNFRNNLSTLTKNHPSNLLFSKILFRLILDGVAAFKFLFDGQPKHFFAVIDAHFSYYYHLPGTLAKRKRMKQISNFNFSTSNIYKGNIVTEYFLRKKTTFNLLDKGYKIK